MKSTTNFKKQSGTKNTLSHLHKNPSDQAEMFNCPICYSKFHSKRSCSLHYRSCLFKHTSQDMSSGDFISSQLSTSLLHGRSQSISILNKGIIQDDIIPIDRYTYKRQKLGIEELNKQFQPVIGNPFLPTDTDNVLSDPDSIHVNSTDTAQSLDASLRHSSNDSSCSRAQIHSPDNNLSDRSNISSDNSCASDSNSYNLDLQMRLLNLEEINTKNTAAGFTNDYIVGFNLMKILNKANSPLYLYDEIMNWATESTFTYNYDFEKSSGSSSRTKLKNFAFECSSSQHLKPIPKYVKIGPKKRSICEVITFDTIGMIHSLLSDPNLMKDENLLFDGQSPYPKFNENTGKLEISDILGDVNTGIWYKKACESLCEGPIDIVCPIIMFIDGLTIDEYSNIQIEPVTFTLGIFNRATRNKAEAWKTLGFINNINHHDTYINDNNDTALNNANNDTNQSIGGMSSAQKLSDYHTILDKILEDLREIQESGGLLWNMEYAGKTFEVRLKFPIQFVIGDCKGHNLLCGRFGSHNNTNSLCRDCDVLLKRSDNTNVICKRITEDKIHHYIDTNNTKQLKKLSFHNLKNNAFRNLCFGGDPCGIYGATLPELLHVLRITLTSHAITAFTDRASQKKIDTLHLISSKIGLHGGRQSDRSFFKIKFSQAITDLAKLDGDHKLGSVFLLFLSLFSSCGLMNFCNDYSNLKLILPAVEQLLIFHEWAMSEEHNIQDLFECTLNESTAEEIDNANFSLYGKSPAYKATKRMMEVYKMGVQRNKGNGFKFPKFHQLLHSILNILRHGSMRNFDGARCEGIGKTNAKEPSRLTQKNTKTVLEQTGLRYVENCIFDKCLSDIEAHLKKFKSSKITTDDAMEDKKNQKLGTLQGSTYRIYIDDAIEEDNREHLILEWMSEKTVIMNYGQALNAAQFAFNYLKIGLDTSDLNIDELCLKTEFICPKGNLYRSHPSYRSEGPWHDWVLVKWEVDNENQELNEVSTEIIPARIYGMFEITGDMVKDDSFIQTGIWMIVSSLCIEPIDNSDALPPNLVQQCFLDKIQLAKKWKIDYIEKGILRFWLVHSQNIMGPAFVVPDIDKKKQICQEHVMVIKPRNEWKDLFIQPNDRTV